MSGLVNTFPITLPAKVALGIAGWSLLSHVLCKHQQKTPSLHSDTEQRIHYLEEISSTALLFLHPSILNPSYLSIDLNSGCWHSSQEGLAELMMYSNWAFASRQGKNTFIHCSDQTVALGKAMGEKGGRMHYSCLLFTSTRSVASTSRDSTSNAYIKGS